MSYYYRKIPISPVHHVVTSYEADCSMVTIPNTYNARGASEEGQMKNRVEIGGYSWKSELT